MRLSLLRTQILRGNKMSSAPRQKIRAAIYTRKSREEGLEQEFNSLDAQHEACAAYITSQRHEGWKQLKGRFDDGGVSGGTMDRPALTRLLADVDQGLVDMIVVYKIDRLTRSLSDFAKLIDRLEAKGCSFVSVTQSFNTSTSMGRLTLNVLLSFAQFEREVTADRIRDKIAASKKKGMWMGGRVPWGYAIHPDPKVQSLEIHLEHAKDIQRIYDLYEELGCLAQVKSQIDSLWPERNYSRGRIYKILTNPIYIGKIRHKTDIYEGLHSAIIDVAQFNRVQEQLKLKSAIKRGTHPTRGLSACLIGKIYDETGDRLTPSNTKRKGRMHRYYYSNRLTIKGADPTGWRIKAETLETALSSMVKSNLMQACQNPDIKDGLTAHELTQYISCIDTLKSQAALKLISRVDLTKGNITIAINKKELEKLLKGSSNLIETERLTFSEPITFQRRQNGTKLIWAQYETGPRPHLIKALHDAHTWLDLLKSGKQITDITQATGLLDGTIWKRVRLACLSPKVQKAILNGTLNPEFTIRYLQSKRVPATWVEQDKLLISKVPC